MLYRSKSGYEALDKAIAYNVDISVISNISDDKKYGYAHDMYNKTTGIYISDDAGYAEKVLEHIYGEAVSIPDEDNGEYNIILATGLRPVELEDTVSHIYADRFKSEDEQVDTDKDGLTDYKEINFGCNLIEFDNGIVTLPTYGACVGYKAELTYVERGLDRFNDVIITDKAFLDYVYETVRVLPIVSDPTSEDGDGDGLPDGHDPLMLSVYNNGKLRSSFSEINLENVKQFDWVNFMYYDFTLGDNPYSIDYYYDLYNIDVEQAVETKSDTIILQKCLEYLGYLDMTSYNYNGLGQLINTSKNDYGTLGGLSKAAVKLYQSNHHLDAKHIIVNEIIDETTFYSIILKASNNGYSFSENDIKYQTEAHDYFDINYNPISYPMNTTKDIVIRKAKNKDIYLYDLTIPLNKILQQGAQEFHEHNYLCSSLDVEIENGTYKTYVDSNEICVFAPDISRYFWLISKVKNNAKYDIKTRKSWDDFFNIIGCDFNFYGSAYQFYFEGEVINAEKFGNILYGFCCNAGNYSYELIALGGSVYSLITEQELDNPEDSEMIEKGYVMFDNYTNSYYYIHGE